jgi:trichothecene 3-O-acetyltransferase
LRLLKEEIVCPRGTLFGSFSDPSIAGVNPTLIVQATFIRGGLVLSILAEHHTMDAHGHGVIMDLLHKACRDEPFTSEELAAVSIDRQNIIPLLDPDTYDPSVLKSRDPGKPPGPATDRKPKVSLADIATQPQWSQFHFPKSSLTTIKDLASTNLPTSTPYISTDDALTAFIFQRILVARFHRLDPSVSSTIARAVNVRPYFPSIPKLYPGMVINMTQTTTTLSSALTDPLSHIAAPMRAAVDPATSTLARDTSTLATLLSVSADKRLGNAASSFDFNVDVMLSSWAKLDCYNLDFGLGLGLPDAVRRPEFTTPFSSLMYLLPKDREEGVVLMICLRNDDMEKLRLDEEWQKFAKEVVG